MSHSMRRTRSAATLLTTLLLGAAAAGSLFTTAVLAAPSSQAGDACVADPTQQACAEYTYTDESIVTDLSDLCARMPFMNVCDVWRRCSTPILESGVTKGDIYCEPWTLLAAGCNDGVTSTDPGMSTMSGCDSYTAMCGTIASPVAGSLVPQCNPHAAHKGDLVDDDADAQHAALVLTLPGTRDAQKRVFADLCTQHEMPGCSECTGYGDCMNPLTALSRVCGSMYHAECDVWHDMCKNHVQSSVIVQHYCGDAGSFDAPPLMRMYFHTGIKDYILFHEWVPTDDSSYYGAVVAIFLLSVFYEALVSGRSMMELYIAQHRTDTGSSSSISTSSSPQKAKAKNDSGGAGADNTSIRAMAVLNDERLVPHSVRTSIDASINGIASTVHGVEARVAQLTKTIDALPVCRCGSGGPDDSPSKRKGCQCGVEAAKAAAISASGVSRSDIERNKNAAAADNDSDSDSEFVDCCAGKTETDGAAAVGFAEKSSLLSTSSTVINVADTAGKSGASAMPKFVTNFVSTFSFEPFNWRVSTVRMLYTFVQTTLSYALMLVTMTFNVGLFFSVVAGLGVGVFLFSRFRSFVDNAADSSCCA